MVSPRLCQNKISSENILQTLARSEVIPPGMGLAGIPRGYEGSLIECCFSDMDSEGRMGGFRSGWVSYMGCLGAKMAWRFGICAI